MSILDDIEQRARRLKAENFAFYLATTGDNAIREAVGSLHHCRYLGQRTTLSVVRYGRRIRD